MVKEIAVVELDVGYVMLVKLWNSTLLNSNRNRDNFINDNVNCARYLLKPTHNTPRGLLANNPRSTQLDACTHSVRTFFHENEWASTNAIFLRREEWKSAESSCHTVQCHIDFKTFLTKTSWQLGHHFLFTYFKWTLGDLYKFSVTMVVSLYRDITASCKFWIWSVFCCSESRTRAQRKYKYCSTPLYDKK